MPKQTAQNPLYAGPGYHNPYIGQAAQNIAAMILGGQSPNDAAETESTAALREAQGGAARASAGKDTMETKILRYKADDLGDPMGTSGRTVADYLNIKDPNQKAIYDTLRQARINSTNPENIAKTENLNRDVSSMLLDPSQVALVGRRNAAVEGKALVNNSDYGVYDIFDKNAPQVPSPLGTAKTSTEKQQGTKYAAEARKADAEAANKVTVDGLDAKSRQKLLLSQPKAKAALGKFLINTDETIKLSMDILEVPEVERAGALDPQRFEKNTAGAAGPESILANIPWTSYADKKALVERLMARSGFNELQEMRLSSPTGGALGNVTEKELYFLQIAATALQNSQTKEQFSRELVNFINRMRDAQQSVSNAYNEQFSAVTSEPTDAGKQRKIVRTGKRNGKKVVQYDDGTIEESP